MTRRGNVEGLLVPLGVPGAGKSYLGRFLTEVGQIPAGAVVSSDAIRLVAPQLSERELFDEVDRQTRESLRELGVAYVDATNLAPHRLEALTSIHLEMLVPVVFILMSTPLSVAVERRQATGTDVPPAIFKTLIKLYEQVDRESLPGPLIESAVVLASPELLRTATQGWPES